MEAVEAWDCGRFLDLAARAATDSEEVREKLDDIRRQSTGEAISWSARLLGRTLVHVGWFYVLC